MDELIKKSNDAYRHYDDVEAKKLLKEWVDFLAAKNIKETDPKLFQKIQNIIIYLKIAAFPQLSENEAADVLRLHFLESFDVEISMENRLTVSLFSIPEIPRDRLRKNFQKALMENSQKLGSLTISQWINQFEKEYPVKTRSLNAPVSFLTTNKNAPTLNSVSKNRLKELLHIYDVFLVQIVPTTGHELTEMLDDYTSTKADTFQADFIDSSDFTEAYNPIISFDASKSFDKTSPVNMDIKDAFNKYKELNEQLITSFHIRLKNYPEPVRPSLKNWISDYTFKTGFESHSSMDRGTYLFQSENTKMLNAIDRRKLGYILKAYDENSQVEIDTENKQIIFPKMETTWRETEIHPQKNKEENEPKDIFESFASSKGRFDLKPKFDLSPKADSVPEVKSEAPLSHKEKVTFTSPQKFPYEMQKKVEKRREAPKDDVPRPMRIRPIESEDEESSKYIVDLKNKD